MERLKISPAAAFKLQLPPFICVALKASGCAGGSGAERALERNRNIDY